MPAFLIRPFRPADAGGLEMIHRRAIMALAGDRYTVAECESWAAGLKARTYIRIAERDEFFWVAQMPHGPLGGFCSFTMRPKRVGEICGLYTDPSFQGQGIASALMRQAEDDLADTGATSIKINASLAAESFYQRFGYETLRTTSHRTRGGLEIDSRDMARMLG